MKKTIIAGGLAAASMAALIGGAALAQTAPAATVQASAQTSAQTAPHRARAETRRAQPVSQADFVQARVDRLTALDADHDGTVTAEELRAGVQARRAERATRRFDRLDADKDGQISRAEFDAARPQRGARADHRGARGGEGHGSGQRGSGQRAAGHGPIVIADVQSKLAEGFARLDADHDGVLSPAERQAGRVAMRERFQHRRAERMAHREARGGNSAPATTSASPSAPASE